MLRELLYPLLLVALFFTTIVSSMNNEDIRQSLLQTNPHHRTTINKNRQVKMWEFLIYLSSDKFQNYILPFLDSKCLLKIYFYFKNNVNQNLTLEKLFDVTNLGNVVDFKNQSYLAYHFTEQKCAIISDSQSIRLYHFAEELPVNNTLETNSKYALFPQSLTTAQNNVKNILFNLYSRFSNEKYTVFFTTDQTHSLDSSFALFVGENKTEKMTLVLHSKIPDFLSDNQEGGLNELLENLDCAVIAYDINFLKKVYFKIFYYYQLYLKYLRNTSVYIFVDKTINLFDQGTCCQPFFGFVFVLIIILPVYHIDLLPFYIFSTPVFLLASDNITYSGIFTKYYFIFWLVPSFFKFLFYTSYLTLRDFPLYVGQRDFYTYEFSFTFNDLGTSTSPEFIWAYKHYLSLKRRPNNWETILGRIFCHFISILLMSFLHTIPFSPLFQINGEEGNLGFE